MMNWFGAALLFLVAVSGFAVVRTRDVTSQIISLGFYGVLLALVFFFFARRMWRCRRLRWARWRFR